MILTKNLINAVKLLKTFALHVEHFQSKARIFLLVDLREFFADLWSRG